MMVDVVLPYTNQEDEVEAKPVELEDGRVILIDPEGLVALALHELGAIVVDVEPDKGEVSGLSEAA